MRVVGIRDFEMPSCCAGCKFGDLMRVADGDAGGLEDMNPCELCEEYGGHDCKRCNLGNPCIGCADYDMWNDTCTSDGACGDSVMRGTKGEE